MYQVIKHFDLFAKGHVLTNAQYADLDERGNIPDLVKNGFLQEIIDEELVALRMLASEKGISHAGRMKKETLLAKLEELEQEEDTENDD